MLTSPDLRWTTAAIFVPVLFLTGCDRAVSRSGNSGTGVDTLPGGTLVMTNQEVGAWRGNGWRLSEDLRIGTVEGDAAQEFGRLAWLELDDLDRIWVMDIHWREVRVFDANGRHVRTIGRAGRGPGEFSRPQSIFKHPDGTMWVIDPGAQRYSVFDTAGTFVESYHRQLSSTIPPHSDGFDLNGRVFETVGASTDGRISTLLLLQDIQAATADTIPLPEFEEEIYEAVLTEGGGVARYRSRVPFTPHLVWRTDPRGYVWHGITKPYRVIQQSLNGDTTRIIERAYTPVPVSGAERDSALESLSGLRDMGASISGSRIPSEKPAFEYFFVDESGYLWVQPVVPGVALTDGARLHTFDVFDPDGMYLGRLRSPLALTTDPAPPGRMPPLVRGNFMYAFHTDTLGVQYVVRLRIEGR